MTSTRVLARSRKPQPAPETLGQRIRAVRVTWGWTQTALADILGSSQSLISEWEKDVSRPSAATLKAIAKLFHLSVSALVKGEKFHIPDSPDSKPHGSVMSKGGVQALEDALPDLTGGGILEIDLGAGSSELVDLKDALVKLREAKKGGRVVWMVVGRVKADK